MIGDSLDELFDSLREGIRLCLEEDSGGNDAPASPLQVKVAVLSDSVSA